MKESTGVKAHIKRCALCKIDLKGRFVYIDDEIEKILGYTKEELFGKYFKSFLKESDHDLVKQLLVQRNHYDTFFEATNIHLVNRQKQIIPATVVISLNFIAGNPVNFQIIINAGTIDNNIESEKDAGGDYAAFLKDFLNGTQPLKRSELVCQIRNFTQAEAVFIYRIENETLNLDSSTIPYESDRANPTELHQRLARTGETYSLTDKDNVQSTIEQEGVAPSEYICRLEFENSYLLRLVFDDNMPPEAVTEAISRAGLAVKLANLLQNYKKPGMTSDLSSNVSFTLNFLDNLGIGAFVTDSSGIICDKNAEALKLFGQKNLDGHYMNLVEFLAGENSPEIARSISTFIDLEGDNRQVDFDIVVSLPGGHKTLLTIFKQALPDKDITACLLFSPLEMMNQESSSKTIEYKLLTLLVNEIKTFLKTAFGFSEKLGHEYYNQLNSEGNFYLLCMKDNLAKLDGMLGHLSKLVTMNENIEIPRLTDLNLVANQVLQELQTLYPGVTINIKLNDMPKIRTWRNKITQIIRDVMSNLIKFSDQNNFSITISARIQNNRCEIEISDNGPALSEGYQKQFFNFFTNVPVKNSPAVSEKNNEPAIIIQLVESLGGKISLSTYDGKGNRINMVIPIIQN